MKGLVILLLTLCLIFSGINTAGAIKAKGSNSGSDTETQQEKTDLVESDGDVQSTSDIINRFEEATNRTDIINPFDDIGTILYTSDKWVIAVDAVDLNDAPDSIKQQVYAETAMLIDGKSTILAGGESLLCWAINEAAKNIGSKQPYITFTQENSQNTPGADVATVGNQKFQGFEWKPSADRDELGTISAFGKEEKAQTVELFPPLIKLTSE